MSLLAVSMQDIREDQINWLNNVTHLQRALRHLYLRHLEVGAHQLATRVVKTTGILPLPTRGQVTTTVIRQLKDTMTTCVLPLPP